MALIIYLDTQDYINLFNEPEDGPNHQVLSELLAYRENGKIVMGFSFATIMEFITKPNAENRSERVRRGQLIKDICGQNAFPYVTDLANGATFPNGGNWMLSSNEKVVSAKKFKRDMHNTLREELAKTDGLNRKQRRRFGRKASMKELIRNNGSTWGRKRSDYGGFPVSDEIVGSRILERFMKGQCSDAEFETRMNAWLSDPAEFSRIMYDYADKPNMRDFVFGSFTDDLERTVKTIQEGCESLRKLNEEQLRIRSTFVDAGISKTTARQLTKQVSLPQLAPESPNEQLEAVLG